ncbi:ribonuclease H-like domain-containing protein [Tanacetum coccineum]|uniref:Ribonuclease H-like domain-containing protein n=1 Tax=Tanacetum coccineum TaxID=301880 RepID=A0ABQ5H453_9ASTR
MIDNTLFIYKTQTNVILVQIHVDNIILESTSTKVCKQFDKVMTQRYEMSMMDVLTYFLGFQIKQSERGISINQEKHVKDLLKKYDINGSSMKTPMVPPNNLGPDLSGKAVNETQYRGMIGSLIAPRNQDNKNKESSRRSVPVETSTSTALVSCDGLGGYDWSDQAEEGPNYVLMAFSSDSEVSKDSICSKSCLETVERLKSLNDQLLKYLKKSELMVLVPPPYKRNFMPPTPDLSFSGLDEFVNKPVVENSKVMSSKEEPKVVRKYDDAPSIEEWVSDDEEEDVSQPKTEKKTVRPNIVKKEFVKSKQQEKIARKTVKQVEQHRQNTHSPSGNQRN